MKETRRNFIGKAGLAAVAITSLTSFESEVNKKKMKNIFVHHVYFWLKKPDSEDDKAKLIDGLIKLSKIKTIKKFHIGKPASTSRDVIEKGYAISWFLQFANDKDQASYQEDPIHLKFVNECSHLWSKVIVYDSIDV